MPVDVRNVLPHMKGSSVNIDGREYKLDAEGVIRGVSDDDAKQLLGYRGTPWRVLTARTPVAATKPEIPASPPPPPLPSAPPQPTIPDLPEKPVVQSSDAGEGVAAVEERIPGPGEEWPDPHEDMSVEYLRKMADAYRVKYSKNTSKKELVKRLAATMYE